ncbi:type IV pilus prepilin peptidase PihH, putative [Syntrophotalea carbinolica DSM 2380]|uniref:Type IV pilus prepilin peptidase PihH, putative n=1 Tax=Syntrophotalea carbinolica (strain DSM 2380 / NBRC 103641 / GraBd1) TaxID=338963 RepID=Q3A675_SYNC1|nr:type IV pilus prepilin peptidase PihH [Syntrophotalea carbinolica]ABA88132.1 type IV pilus prepilin peptidase PihH, putative [Syntrophotalea carbinolica DSM 2380]
MSSDSAQPLGKKSKSLARRFKRRNYFINKPFQLAFAGNMLVITFLACVFTALYVSWMFVYVLDDRLLVGGVLNGYYLLKIGLMLAGLVTGVVIWTILRTHAIAGPIYRVQKILRDAAEGRFPQRPIAFRRGDAFMGLAEDLNRCLDSMQRDRKRLERLRAYADEDSDVSPSTEDLGASARAADFAGES